MRIITRHPVAFAQIAVIAAVLACAQNCFQNRVDPEAVSQATWYRMAIPEDERDVALPRKHEVVFEPYRKSEWEVLLSYLPPPVGEGGTIEAQGKYDCESGSIIICGDMAVLQAGLPDALQPQFKATLRHEYGHAFFSDWLKGENTDTTEHPCEAYRVPADELDSDEGPGELHPVIAEYKEASPSIYGLPYFTSTFDEYMAQSYARFVQGDDIPPHTASFLKTECTGE